MLDIGGFPQPAAMVPRVATLTPADGLAQIDWSRCDIARVTLNAATVTLSFVGAVEGQRCLVELIQDATGSRAIALPTSVAYDAGIASAVVNGTAGAATALLFIYRAGGYHLAGMSSGGVLWPFQSYAGDPTTADISAGNCAVWLNSSSGAIKIWANVAGTLKSVTLS